MDKNDNEESYDRISESNKVGRNKKIKKQTQKSEKTKDKAQTQKITDFFKKTQIQRPFSSVKLNLKRTAEQEQLIQRLNAQYQDQDQQQNQLKKEIQQLRQKYQVMIEEQALYFKKVRQSLSNDLKKRYNVIRKEKKIASYERGYSYEGYAMAVGQLESELIKKIAVKKLHLQTAIGQFEREWIKNELKKLQKELLICRIQTEQYEERFNLSLKEDHCKFAKLNWPIINKKYQILELIGAGGYSQVYSAYNLYQPKSNKKIAIKLCSVKEMSRSTDGQYLKHVIRQCQTHKQLDHPLIAKLLEVIQMDSSTLCLVIEFCEGIELSKHLRRKKCLSEYQAKSIMIQIFEVLLYLSTRQNKIIHYDLKPQNIMVYEGKIKVLDFGLSKSLENQNSRQYLTSQGMGTYFYLPPQVFEPDPIISNKVDIWSAGVIFYQLLYGQRPFGYGVQGEPQRMIEMQGSKSLYFPEKYNVSEGAQLFISECLQNNQRKRLSPQKAYYHEYFDDMLRNVEQDKKKHDFKRILRKQSIVQEIFDF